MKPRFLLDEQLSRKLAEAARSVGLDVTAVSDSPWAGRDDVAILGAAVAEGRILVTIDIGGFIPLITSSFLEGIRIPGLILIHPKTFPSQDVKVLLRSLKSMADRIERGEVDPSMGITLTR